MKNSSFVNEINWLNDHIVDKKNSSNHIHFMILMLDKNIIRPNKQYYW